MDQVSWDNNTLLCPEAQEFPQPVAVSIARKYGEAVSEHGISADDVTDMETPAAIRGCWLCQKRTALVVACEVRGSWRIIDAFTTRGASQTNV